VAHRQRVGDFSTSIMGIFASAVTPEWNDPDISAFEQGRTAKLLMV
jgi:hypothetical protein